MKQRVTKKTILATALSLALFTGPAGHVQAFKGIGSSGGGHGATAPQEINISGHEGNTETIVATINGADISMGKLMSTMINVIKKGGYQGDNLSKEMALKIRYEALENLAMEELAYQEALALGFAADPAVVQAQIDAMIKREGGRDAFDTSLKAQKKSEDDIREEISRYLAVRKAINQEVDEKVTVSSDEIDTVYANNRDQFVSAERVVVTDIVFFLDPSDPDSKKQVKAVREKILTEHNNNPSALPPEGFVVESQINVSPTNRAKLYEAAKKMEVGSLSEPLVIDDTLHLVKFVFHQPRKETPVEEAKATVAKKIKAAKRRELLAKWRQGLMEKADIKIVHEIMKDPSSQEASEK